MYFDDRLATVLRHRATGERAARTQYRQLLDLLGEGREGRDESLEAAAFLRLDALSEMVPMRERARIVGESGARIRNAALVRWFGEAEPDVAAAALARASLPADAWAEIIPELPVRARGFLRHRRDLPRAAVDILDRLGVRDRALPEPEISHDPFNLPPIPLPLELEIEDAIETGEEHESKRESLPQPPAPDPVAAAPTYSGAPKDRRIGEIVRRIEAFSKARGVRDGETFAAGDAPHLPLDEYDREPHRKAVQAFSFGTDTRGRLDWADVEVAPMVLGFDVARLPGVAGATNALPSAFANRQPVREAQVRLDGAHSIAGSWIIDASPRFAPNDGRFTGYLGRFRRLRAESTSSNASSEADRIRQLLHELRTPVNAIQGFAEVIQQQIFGATPHEYRALAASIAGDSARMLAGFDELDRLAGLESGAFELDRGVSDLAAIARKLVGQLQTVLNPRVAGFEARWPDRKVPVALAEKETEMLAWRMLGTLASATGAGEKLELAHESEGDQTALSCALPAALASAEELFSTDTRPSGGALSAGIFGAGFSLRLARAEARAAGGDLTRVDDRLVLSLPLLTPEQAAPSPETVPNRAAG